MTQERFRWNTFKGTVYEDLQRSRLTSKTSIQFHVYFIIILAVVVATVLLMNLLFPRNLNYWLARYLGL